MDYEQIIEKFFRRSGFSAEKIPEGRDRTPDFLVYDGSFAYLVELKTKLAAKEEIEERNRILQSGEIYQLHETIQRESKFSKKVKEAVRQLDYVNEEDVLQLVWLMCVGHKAESCVEQYRATLYGLADIVSENGARDCYFFHNSDFYNHRNSLDGAIVSDDKHAWLCLNPLSPRYETLKTSSLAELLANAVEDPLESEAQGKSLIVDSNVDRNNTEAVLRFLENKYQLAHPKNLTMEYLTGTMWISDRGR